jgi:hypothetical protein
MGYRQVSGTEPCKALNSVSASHREELNVPTSGKHVGTKESDSGAEAKVGSQAGREIEATEGSGQKDRCYKVTSVNHSRRATKDDLGRNRHRTMADRAQETAIYHFFEVGA